MNVAPSYSIVPGYAFISKIIMPPCTRAHARRPLCGCGWRTAPSVGRCWAERRWGRGGVCVFGAAWRGVAWRGVAWGGVGRGGAPCFSSCSLTHSSTLSPCAFQPHCPSNGFLGRIKLPALPRHASPPPLPPNPHRPVWWWTRSSGCTWTSTWLPATRGQGQQEQQAGRQAAPARGAAEGQRRAGRRRRRSSSRRGWAPAPAAAAVAVEGMCGCLGPLACRRQ